MVLSRVRVAGPGAKALYRFTNAVQLAALQRPTASRNTHQTKAIAIGDGGGIGLGRCDLFGGQLMLTGLQADIGIQLCRGGVLRQTASSLMTYHTVIQMRQRMRVSSSFSEQKRCGERSAHSQFSSDFRNCGASKQGRAPQLNCIKLSQEYSKKETAECVFLLTQDAFCDSRRTHSTDFFPS